MGVIAVVPVRGGTLVTGGDDAIVEAGGTALLIGDGASAAGRALVARATAVGRKLRAVSCIERAGFRPAEWSVVLAPFVADSTVVILPATPDGRDLAPRLAVALGRPMLASAVRITEHGALLARWGGRQVARFRVGEPFVATLLFGGGSAFGHDSGSLLPVGLSTGSDTDIVVRELEAAPPAADDLPADAEVLEVLEADPAAMDLSEADRIFAAGAGLGGAAEIALLQSVAARLGASVGATRVVTDAGLLGHERQIGTTGVSVQPRCYVAFGISGAAQHVGGLGHPTHVIAVNTDRSCPMMATADLALVTDVKALVAVLARRLTVPTEMPEDAATMAESTDDA